MKDSTEFKLTRLEAIEAHSSLEFWLCDLFRVLVGCDHKTASRIFYVMGAISRYKLMGKLFEDKYSQYFKAWKKFANEIDKLNHTRNKIVHWETLYSEASITLVDPKKGMSSIPLDLDDQLDINSFRELIQKVNDVLEVIPDFAACIEGRSYKEWEEVYTDVTDVKTIEDFKDRLKALEPRP
jgi:hypothetical protein